MEFILFNLFGALLGAALILVPGIAFSFLVHYLLSMPMNRRDRARFFLDLMETALNRGQAMEQAILSAAESRDPRDGGPVLHARRLY